MAAARAAVEARRQPGASSRRRPASPEAEEPLGPAAPESNGAEPHGSAAAEAPAPGSSLGAPPLEPVDGVAHARVGGPASRGQVWMKHQLPGHELQARSTFCAIVLAATLSAQLVSGGHGIKGHSTSPAWAGSIARCRLCAWAADSICRRLRGELRATGRRWRPGTASSWTRRRRTVWCRWRWRWMRAAPSAPMASSTDWACTRCNFLVVRD